nr:hypothetical protein [Candidatus Sigynarchaeum springense]
MLYPAAGPWILRLPHGYAPRRSGDQQFSSIVEFNTGDTITVNCIPGLRMPVDVIFKGIK